MDGWLDPFDPTKNKFEIKTMEGKTLLISTN